MNDQAETASCADNHNPGLLTMDDARTRIVSSIEPISEQEEVGLWGALGRVLAEDIHSPIDVPPYTNSAMDGYALNSHGVEQGATLQVIGTSWAGKPFAGRVETGECARIMTGGVIPDGADAVVMQEVVQREADTICLQRPVRAAENVRPAGEDLAAGARVLGKGQRIRPADLGLLASIGVAEVTVTRRPRVTIFCTGDELRAVGQPLKKGEIYDSNRYTLYSMLERLGVEIIDLGVIPDQPAALEKAFGEAMKGSDAVITTGGVSVGDADYVTGMLEKLGQIDFWKIAIKPGRPLAFGRLGEGRFFGLPGNPVSVMVTFYQFVQPALRRMMGETPPPRILLQIPSATPLRKRPGRAEFQRGILETGEDGTLVVRSTGHQGSGILRSMSEANCFIILTEESSGVEAGELVSVEPFQGLV